MQKIEPSVQSTILLMVRISTTEIINQPLPEEKNIQCIISTLH